MREVFEQGKSTSKIISEFMKKYNMELDDFKFEVTEEGSKGFLNLFGQKPTTIKFFIPDVSDKLKEYTEGLLKRMNVKYSTVRISSKKDSHFVDIKGVDNPGFLIGKEGKMLDSFQDLLNQMINKYEKRKNTVTVNVDGYRQRKRDNTTDAIKSYSRNGKKRDKSLTLRPLKASQKPVRKPVRNKKIDRAITVSADKKKHISISPAENSKFQKRADRKI